MIQRKGMLGAISDFLLGPVTTPALEAYDLMRLSDAQVLAFVTTALEGAGYTVRQLASLDGHGPSLRLYLPFSPAPSFSLVKVFKAHSLLEDSDDETAEVARFATYAQSQGERCVVATPGAFSTQARQAGEQAGATMLDAEALVGLASGNRPGKF
jgi:hypothetical protein